MEGKEQGYPNIRLKGACIAI